MTNIEKKIIKKIDSSLSYVQTFYVSSTLVYQVKRRNSFYILKGAQQGNKWQVEHLEKEKRNLIVLSDVPRISHLVQAYDGEYSIEEFYIIKNVILKEFCEGET